MITLKSQKYEVFKLIREIGLNPNNFKWTWQTTSYGEMELIKYSDYYFEIRKFFSKTTCKFSPGKKSFFNEKSFTSQGIEFPWSAVSKCIFEWINYVKREETLPDFLNEAGNYQFIYDSKIENDISNKPFTKNEAEKIVLTLQKIKGYLEEQAKESKEHINFINEKIDYLVDAIKRLGRKDWIHTCIGVIATIITALALSPEQRSAIWSILKESLSTVIHLLK